ncbi:hypothetical protein [Buchnera aphidicola]|uniref:primosomal protein N' family DNA-binding protein n=1 Tax=Buchnera aphidicola TaxID=9 RepID=UPI0020B8987F|nr:hypothetical protein [Buchnera aphidicola]
MIIVKVALPVPIRKYFKYFMPDYMNPIIGGRILVPFNSKDVIGIVVSWCKKNDISQLKLKHAKSLIDTEVFCTNIILELIDWISTNYHCPVGNLFFSILPKILHSHYPIENKYIHQWSITKKGQELDLSYLKRKKKQLHTLLFLKKKAVLSTELKEYHLSRSILKKLEIQELCKIKSINAILIKKKIFLNLKKNFF